MRPSAALWMPSSADSTAAMPILTQIQFIANQPKLMAGCRPTSQLGPWPAWSEQGPAAQRAQHLAFPGRLAFLRLGRQQEQRHEQRAAQPRGHGRDMKHFQELVGHARIIAAGAPVASPEPRRIVAPAAKPVAACAVEAGRAVSGVAPSDASTAPGVASAARLRR